MQDRYIPVDADGSSRPAEAGTAFMLRCLLQSRADVGIPSDDDGRDHDVNIYLAQLLGAYADPQYYVRIGSYISPHDTTVFETAQHSSSKRFRYRVYRVNADHLLMSIGVFNNPDGRRPDSLSAAFRPTEATFVGRAKTYYDFASTYSQSVFGRTSAVAGVLEKLAVGFERYVRVLSQMRGEYFGFIDRLGDGELYHLDRAALTEGVQVLRDEFLDRFAEYKRSGTPEARQRLQDTVERLRRVDPSFKFDALQ
jgi:hypothetical protein